MNIDGGKKTAAYSTLLNLTLTVVKALIAFFSGSAAVLGEAIHSLTDVLGSVSVLVGINLSGKKSPQFPWGLYKAENIAAVISSLLIFLMAYEVARNTFTGEAKELANINLSIVALVLMALPVYLFARHERKKAKELNSPSLMADSKHWLSDLAPLGIVVAGLAASRSFPNADRVAAIVVIAFVLRAGYGIMKDSIKSLLDASVDRFTLIEIGNVIRDSPEVNDVITLNARNSGRFIFVHADLSLSLKRLKNAHDVANRIEKDIRDRIPLVERVVIHYEPQKKEYRRFAVPLLNMEGSISEHFGSSPYIALWDVRVSDGSVLSREMVENPFASIEKGKGLKLAELLSERGVDVLYTTESLEGKSPQYVLSDAEIEVRRTTLKELKDLISLKQEDDENA
jgi:cation diffusion facilitator family transporter